jgi:hypothetical protein
MEKLELKFPNGDSEFPITVPPLRVNPPVNVFTPVKVSVLAPFFVKLPELEITPDKVISAVEALIVLPVPVRVTAPSIVTGVALLLTIDPPERVNLSSAGENPKRSRVPLTVVAPVVSPKAAALPNFKFAPAPTVVAPE